MPDLERDLRALAASVEFPPTPDLARVVRGRIEGEPRPVRGLVPVGRRAVLVALVLVVAALGAALAVPAARTALLEWLGIRGVTVTRVETAPTAPLHADLGLGEPVTLDEARARVPFPLAVPPPAVRGAPDEIFVAQLSHGPQVAFVWGNEDGEADLLLTQTRASLEREFVQKLAGPGTTMEEVDVNGAPGLWLAGAPHAFAYVTPDGAPVEETLRLADNTLLWERDRTTFRLEGDLTRAEALALAESLAPAG